MSGERLSDVIVDRLLREMEGYLELGLHDEVVERANRLLDAGRKRTRALEMKARALQDAERFAEAIPVWEALRDLVPTGDSAHLGLAWCYKRTGRLDASIEAMESLLVHEPKNALGVYNLACYLALDGQRDRPLELLRRAIALDESFREHARGESDYDSLREDPEFREIVGG